MSAFICTDTDFAVIGAWAEDNLSPHWLDSITSFAIPMGGTLEDKTARAEIIANILKQQNVRSVSYRYREHNECDPVSVSASHRKMARNASPIKIIGALDMAEYQSGETPEYEFSLAAKVFNYLRSVAVTKIPGYEWHSFDR